MAAERTSEGLPEAPELGAGSTAAPGELAAAGERIEVLLEASSSAGFVQRERAEELVRLVTDLYGTGIERILEILDRRGLLDGQTLDELSSDELVSSLLVVHGLHPYTVEERIEHALEKVRPYLGSHGGDVELLGVDDAGIVQLRLLGSCDGCPSSAVTLQLAVEGAIETAAPEIAGIEVETPLPASAGGHSLISVDALRSRLDGGDRPADVEWLEVAELANLEPGDVVGLSLGDRDVFACRGQSDVFVYRDVCPACAGSFAGSTLREVTSGVVAIRCPTCGKEYDVRRAGADAHGGHGHLDPLPVLLRGENWSVALPLKVSA